MDHNTKKQIGVLELRIQELRRENEEREGANEALRAKNEAITTEAKKLAQENEQLSAINEHLRAKIDELEEQKADQEAQLNYQKSMTQKLEGFQSKKTFTVKINIEIEDGLFTEPVSFTFPDYKSMDDFIQMAMLHGEGNLRFVIQKGED